MGGEGYSGQQDILQRDITADVTSQFAAESFHLQEVTPAVVDQLFA